MPPLGLYSKKDQTKITRWKDELRHLADMISNAYRVGDYQLAEELVTEQDILLSIGPFA